MPMRAFLPACPRRLLSFSSEDLSKKFYKKKTVSQGCQGVILLLSIPVVKTRQVVAAAAAASRHCPGMGMASDACSQLHQDSRRRRCICVVLVVQGMRRAYGT
jgi:hypothetical protein